MTADEALPDESRHQPRRDVTEVPLQGGYVAKRCPLRVQYDVFPPAGVERLSASPFARALMDDGVVFEADVFAEIISCHGDVVAIDEAVHRDERRALTEQAMSDGREVILGGELPADLVGRRVGKPDVLVRAEKLGDSWAYHPVDVKHHRTVVAATKPDTPLARCSDLADVAFASASPLTGWKASENKDDLLQLAHYHRMLAATGHASRTPVGGIIGKERHVTWYDLDTPMFWQRWFGQQHPEESALELYDFEFSFGCGSPEGTAAHASCADGTGDFPTLA